ncbi:RNA-binding protein [Staphylococcus phage S-CoN_Ph16]|nr:RNA-binding protein [Staphylococcus phage S-CoN_Ph16]
MSSFLEKLKTEDNKALTFNGENGYKSTLNDILDLSTEIGNSRFLDNDILFDKLINAQNEDELLYAKLVFYARDIRQGGGDKTLGRFGLVTIYKDIDLSKIPLLVTLIAEYGSFKDVMYLLATPIQDEDKELALCQYLNSLLNLDDNNEQAGLLAKYMPTETTKDHAMKAVYRKFMKYVNITPKEYRKRNTRIRKKLDIVETKLTEKRYEDIDYSHVPSQANLKYRDAFIRNDKERYTDYLEKVDSGEEKINSGTLAPYQIVDKVRYSNSSSLNTLWNNIPAPTNNGLEILPVVDVSGSMYGLLMDVAVSLGIFLSEHNKGQFKDHFITFSNEPELKKIKGNTIRDKVSSVESSNWGMNTDLEKTFDLILKTAINNDLTQEELPKSLLIISDMQFDEATTGGFFASDVPKPDDTFFEKMKHKFKQHGYKLPFIVFWNVGYGNTKPVVKTTKNTILVSGFSQNIFNSICNLDLDDLEKYTPLKALLEILESDRYKAIEGLYQTTD